VRESRFTKELLDQNGEFTINVPVGEYDKSILNVCGTRSGRDLDKVQVLGLTLEEPETISVPGIRQLPLTLECKVIYKQEQDENALDQKVIERYYPEENGKKDIHTAYYGQVLSAYIIED
jgi:flavin reductase (DIM6/NTAB) family NADH-FMN oxidoreductase RutF